MKNMFVSFESGINEPFKTIRTDMNSLKNSIDFVSSNFDTLCEEINQTKNDMKCTSSEIHNLKEEKQFLKSQLLDIQQHSRRDNIVVHGITELQN